MRDDCEKIKHKDLLSEPSKTFEGLGATYVHSLIFARRTKTKKNGGRTSGSCDLVWGGIERGEYWAYSCFFLAGSPKGGKTDSRSEGRAELPVAMAVEAETRAQEAEIEARGI